MRDFPIALLVACLVTVMGLAGARPVAAQSDEEVVNTLNDQFLQLYRAGKYPEAALVAERLRAAAEQRFGPDHPQAARALTHIGTVSRVQGRLADAEPYYRRALTIFEKSLGPENINVAITLNELGQVYYQQGRLADAEPCFVRAIDVEEKLLGPDHPQLATPLNNLAALYRAQSRYALAITLRKRTIAILEKAKGPDDPAVAIALDNLAVLYQNLNNYTEAETLTERALSILEKNLGPDHPDVGVSLNNLASIYTALRKYAQAEALYLRSITINEKRLGSNHLEVARTLDNLAGLYRFQGKYGEAEPVYRRALAIFEETFGPDHPDVGIFYNNLSGFYFDQGKWASSLEYARKGTGVFMRRAQRGLDLIGEQSAGRSRAQAERQGLPFMRLVKAAYKLSETNGTAQLSSEAFQAAQWAHASEAATSLAQMAVRSAAGNRDLALLVRERQDLLTYREKRSGLLVWSRSQPADERDARVDQMLQTQLAGIDARLLEIDLKLKESFPQYASFVTSDSLDITEVQSWLRPGEALVLFLDTPEVMPFLERDLAKPMPEETYIWVVTKTQARWLRIQQGTNALGEQVAALRCGLDNSLWLEAESAEKCADLLHASPSTEPVDGRDVRVLPFDATRAYELYEKLLGPAADLIKGTHLLIVPSGPLAGLPFNVLVVEPPKANSMGKLAGYRETAWLGTRQPISVLPSVTSLKILRQLAKASTATKPYLGVGNPLLNGQQDDPKWGDLYKRLATAALDRQQCPKATIERVAQAAAPSHRGASGLFLGQNADIEKVRHLSPLPDTADELCEVGRRLGVADGDILLGARATEAELKDLSDSGRLADYAVLHFATHGVLTGQVQGVAEPGLILTPPPAGTSDRALTRNDGYLSASEIAALKLDADWVVLSACNTAGGSAETAESLSGLARAFFYAGARALLVSHWDVDSAAAVKLTTAAFAALKSSPTVGRAEALRRSMRALVDNGTPAEAHPAMWAPFEVVGEGGAVAANLSTQAINPQPATPARDGIAPSNNKRGKKRVTTRAHDWRTTIWRYAN